MGTGEPRVVEKENPKRRGSPHSKQAMDNEQRKLPLLVHRDHRRTFADNLYVYAVVSRRSKGVSIGLNLNPDKICNFDCVYCQVDRSTPGPVRGVDLGRLRDELE